MLWRCMSDAYSDVPSTASASTPSSSVLIERTMFTLTSCAYREQEEDEDSEMCKDEDEGEDENKDEDKDDNEDREEKALSLDADDEYEPKREETEDLLMRMTASNLQ